MLNQFKEQKREGAAICHRYSSKSLGRGNLYWFRWEPGGAWLLEERLLVVISLLLEHGMSGNCQGISWSLRQAGRVALVG